MLPSGETRVSLLASTETHKLLPVLLDHNPPLSVKTAQQLNPAHWPEARSASKDPLYTNQPSSASLVSTTNWPWMRIKDRMDNMWRKQVETADVDKLKLCQEIFQCENSPILSIKIRKRCSNTQWHRHISNDPSFRCLQSKPGCNSLHWNTSCS